MDVRGQLVISAVQFGPLIRLENYPRKNRIAPLFDKEQETPRTPVNRVTAHANIS